MAKYEEFVSPWLRPPIKMLYNHAISWQFSFKFCGCSSYGVMTIWVKFQENWSGCLDHFSRIDTEWPFRDRKCRFIVFLVGFSAITREPLKVCRQVKHCTKGSRELFYIGLTASYVCTWNFLENPIFCFVSYLFGKVLDDFQKNSLPPF